MHGLTYITKKQFLMEMNKGKEIENNSFFVTDLNCVFYIHLECEVLDLSLSSRVRLLQTNI